MGELLLGVTFKGKLLLGVTFKGELLLSVTSRAICFYSPVGLMCTVCCAMSDLECCLIANEAVVAAVCKLHQSCYWVSERAGVWKIPCAGGQGDNAVHMCGVWKIPWVGKEDHVVNIK